MRKCEIAKLYLDEWKHRDEIYNKHTFVYFFAILVISVFPYINFSGFSSRSLLDGMSPIIFHTLAAVLSVFAFYLSKSLAERLLSVFEKYDEILKDIKPVYMHGPNENKSKSIARHLSYILFGGLFFLNVFFIILNVLILFF